VQNKTVPRCVHANNAKNIKIIANITSTRARQFCASNIHVCSIYFFLLGFVSYMVHLNVAIAKIKDDSTSVRWTVANRLWTATTSKQKARFVWFCVLSDEKEREIALHVFDRGQHYKYEQVMAVPLQSNVFPSLELITREFQSLLTPKTKMLVQHAYVCLCAQMDQEPDSPLLGFVTKEVIGACSSK